MSSIIDSKVVEMRFDNKNFEKNVDQSMSTLDKLKKALKLDGATKGLSEVEQRANSIRFNVLANTIDNVASRFTGLQTIGTMAILRLSKSISDAGINLVKSLSVDNIAAGWNKLQQKANSMSTLLSQGYKTDVVEEQLEKLLWFSDETSYNFTDMIDNIAKFTASGKDLGDSVTAMQGIALWAAKSGQNAQKASAAMYQLSQALGAGVMRKEDWKSIQNASMDTAEFRQQALDTAIALGTLKKVGEDTYQALTGNKKKFTKSQFAENLTEGQWFTSDVMMEVYKKYAKASDQMKAAIDIMAKDHGITLTAGQMIKAYDALKNNTFDKFLKEEEIDDKKAVESLKNLVSAFDEFGVSTFKAGQEYRTFNDVIDATKDAVSTKIMKIFETFIGNIDKQKALWTTIGETFYEWFAEPLQEFQELLNRWVDMGGRDSLHKAISNIATAIGKIVEPIKEAWSEIFPSVTAKQLTELTKKFQEFTSKLFINKQTAEGIKSIFKALFSVMKLGITIVKTLASAVIKLVTAFGPLGELLIVAVGHISKLINKVADFITNSKWLTNTLNTLTSAVKSFIDNTVKMFKKILSFESLLKFFSTLFELVKAVGNSIGTFISKLLSSGNLTEFMKLINSGLVGGVLYSLIQIFKKADKAVENVKKWSSVFKDVFGGLTSALKELQTEIKAKAVKQIAISVAILVGSLWLLSGIDSEALGRSLGAITVAMAELMLCFKAFTSITKDNTILARNSFALISLSLSILTLSAALKNIGSLRIDQMAIALAGLGIALQIFIHAFKMLPSDGETIYKTTGLLSLSLSLLVLSVALKKIGNMNVVDIIKALTTMLISLVVMTKTINSINMSGIIPKALSLLVVANTMIVLAGALKLLGSLSWNEIARGLTAMGGALSILAITMNILDGGNKQAMSIFGNSGATNVTGKKGGPIGKSFALLGATLSLVVLAGALKILATLSWSDIARSLLAMGGALTLLVVAMKIMGSDVKGAGTLFVAAASLIALAMGLKILSSIDPAKMAKAIIGLASALLVLGVAGFLLSKAAIGLILIAGLALAFGAAMFAVGVAVLNIGLGLNLIATGIAGVAAALSAGAAPVAAAISSILLSILDLVPSIVKAIGTAIKELYKVIVECAPLIAKALGAVILEAIKMLVEFIPPIVTAILDLIIQVIRSITNKVPELILSIAELLSAIFKGFMEAMNLLDSRTLVEGIRSIGLITSVFLLLAYLAVLAPYAMVGIVAFAGLLTELAWILQMMSGFKSQVKSIEKAGDVLLAIGTAIGKFIGGIIGGFGVGVSTALPTIATNLTMFMNNLQGFLSGANSIKSDIGLRLNSLAAGILTLTYANFVNGLMNIISLGNSLPKVGKDLSDFMKNIKPFIEGAILITPNMMQGIMALGNAIILLSKAQLKKSITDLFSWFTGNAGFDKFGKEISKLGTGLKTFVKNLGEFGPKEEGIISSACECVKKLAETADKIPKNGGLVSLIAGDNDISVFALKLPLLGISLKKFVDNLGSFNDNSVTAVTTASEALVVLAKAAAKLPKSGGLVDLFIGNNDISLFAIKLPTTAYCLNAFVKNLGNIDSTAVDKARFAGEILVALAEAGSKVPRSGGLVDLFIGSNDIALFSVKLPTTAFCLNTFVKNLGNIDKSSVDKAKFAGAALTELAKAGSKVPRSGGIVDLFAGFNDIGLFSMKLPIVALGLRNFVHNLGTFSDDEIKTTECAGKALTALAKAADAVNGQSPLSILFEGDNDISRFASKFPTVAEGLRGFVDKLTENGGFTDEQVKTTDCAARAIKALAKAANDIPPENGIWQKLAGQQSLAAFSSTFPTVGTALSDFVKNLGEDFNETKIATIETACTALKTLAGVSKSFPATGGVWQWLSGENDPARYASKFGIIAKGLNEFIEEIKDVSKEKLDSVKTASEALTALASVGKVDFSKLSKNSDNISTFVTDMSSFIKGLSKINPDSTAKAKENAGVFIELINNFASINANNIKKLAEGLKTIGESGITAFIDSLSGDSSVTRVSQAVRDLVLKILDTMEAKRSEIESKMESIISSAVNKINDLSMMEKVKSAGKDFAQGFANGIDENRYLAVDAGTRLGEYAYKAAKQAIDAHSPSKKTHELGNYFGMGFINGIHEYNKAAYDESYSMAEYANKGLTKAISKVNDILNDENTNQPTIRPVLDLSDVESEAGRIGGLFNNVSLGSNLNAISYGMKQKGQNGTTNDVVTAINRLGSKLDNQGDTYNINGVSYSGDDEVQDAIRTLVRAATVEGRV